ncbi:pyridoxal-phosphate dependent enzyme [Streptomyces griseoincarnatus]
MTSWRDAGVDYHDSVADLIGGTPLVRLRSVTAGLSATVLAKLEYLNPCGSVKDRIARRMVESAERDGRLRPGGTLVEPTSGNTGLGLAMLAQQRGYRAVFTCPDKVSPDKIRVLRAYGAEVVVCPAAVPVDHAESYRSVSDRLAREIPGAVKLDQYSNPDNPASHYHGTGPELWAQTAGRITHFVASIGTGGTISGIGRHLKEVSDGRVRVIGADPEGSVYSGGTGRPYLLEGVGQPGLPASFDPGVPDEILAVPDAESLALTVRLAREEAMLVGGSGGLAVAAALRTAAKLGPDALVVVLLPDSGRGYLSKIFDDRWMARYGFSEEPGAGPRYRDLLRTAEPLVTVGPDDTVEQAVKVLHERGLPGAPVTAAEAPVRSGEILGSVRTGALAEALLGGRALAGTRAAEVMGPVPPFAGAGERVIPGSGPLTDGGFALVLEAGLVRAAVTAHDVLRHWQTHPPTGDA